MLDKLMTVFWIALAAVVLIFVVLVVRGIREFLSRRKWKKQLEEGKITEAEYQTAIDRLDKKIER